MLPAVVFWRAALPAAILKESPALRKGASLPQGLMSKVVEEVLVHHGKLGNNGSRLFSTRHGFTVKNTVVKATAFPVTQCFFSK